MIYSREEPEKQSLLRRPGVKATSDNVGKLVSGRNWVCDVCRSSNNPNTSICSVCHQARTITPINVSPVFGDPTDSDRMEVAVDMAHTKPVEKHHNLVTVDEENHDITIVMNLLFHSPNK